MVVNGLRLPGAFVQLVSQPNATSDWMLKEDRDAYGNHWEVDLELCTDLGKIMAETEYLPQAFKLAIRTPEEIERGDALSANKPGSIPFITDFSQVVRFGRDSAGDEGPRLPAEPEPALRVVRPPGVLPGIRRHAAALPGGCDPQRPAGRGAHGAQPLISDAG